VRALLSVYDRTGLVALAEGLHSLGWELLASGGTAEAIRGEGIPVIDTAEYTGSPAILGHRVVTLHPKLHGGILADRDNAEHRADMEAHGIEPIDLVVSNLYPFRAQPSIDMIDIGGPTLVRAAAKNHAHVAILVDPSDYQATLDEIQATNGVLSDGTKRRLARKAFAHTAAYDAAIVTWLDESGEDRETLPPTIHIAIERAQELRYGENPHQQGARYRQIGRPSLWDDVTQHGGMALSYLNLYDADAAWQLAHDLGTRPAVAIIKHANPCGLAVADDLATAYRLAFECDTKSAFGGIVALNRPVDEATVAEIEAAAQADVIIAPGYQSGTIERIAAKRRNTRVLEAPAPTRDRLDLRQITGGFLVQQAHHFATARGDWRVVTKESPTEGQWADVELAWRVGGHVKSNSIVLVKDGQAVGIGAGQQNRVDAARIAAEKAAGRATGGACASDAFFPFPDGIEAAADAGVAVVVQPGGAMHDDDIVARADELGLAMVFTGERHFLH